MMTIRQWRRFIGLLSIGTLILLGGCAGPLEQTTRRDLRATFVGQRYVAQHYLGSRHFLAYTNNAIRTRHPTGIFVDQALKPWYETDATFSESGRAGEPRSESELRGIDGDLDLKSFAQGITPGQVITITRLTDRSEQLIVEVETLERYDIRKTYGVVVGRKPQPRASRIHLMFGKEGMQALDYALLQQMLTTVLAPAPTLNTDEEKTAYILSHFPDTSLTALMELTGLAEYDVLLRYYAGVLKRSDFPPAVQDTLADLLARQYTLWFRNAKLLLQDARAGARTLVLDFAFQEMSQSLVYHSPELRAAYFFFQKFPRVLEALQGTLALLAGDDAALVIRCSYQFVDNFGQTSPEEVEFRMQADDIADFAVTAIPEQEFADRAEIRINGTAVAISLDSLQAVERLKNTVPASWKEVEVELVDWWYEEDEASNTTVIRGEVRNTGTWLADEVEITVEGYDEYGLTAIRESTMLFGVLPPGELERFELNIDTSNVHRLSRPRLTWKAVE